ncbi:hypothetical protein [Lentibacillus cibarius]|uniref:hypothetical protein n=1 Tax=Lentibacillus cibarius TaxID=2583219 RepID=UPI0014867933|nr:hypothetical protein [Lentibacillus cibarius]
MVFGGVLGIGVIVDLVAKFKDRKIEIDEDGREKSESERIYSESFKDHIKHEMRDRPF